MKRKSWLVCLFLCFFSAAIFANEWQVEERKYNENYFWYFIKETPPEYKYLKETCVFALQANYGYKNLYSVSLKERMEEFLEEGKFEIQIEDGIKQVFLLPEFLDINLDLSKEELKSIWKLLSKDYAGFSDMKKKGFNKDELLAITKSDDLKNLLDKYIEDCHFELNLREFYYSQKTAHDDGTNPSKDPENIYFEKETKNAYYVRFNNCTSDVYNNEFEKIYLKALEKDFLIIDARSNHGGSNWPQIRLKKSLSENKYKGTVYVLQDNWSFSSGEVWEIFGEFGGEHNKINCKLVGTHSGGMQNYGNCRVIGDKKNHISIYCGKSNFRKDLPSNYLGDGKGYNPDIWATTENMKATLEGLGVDLTGIDFQ